MAAIALPEIPRRVKVYELQDEKWFDRGTGYCTGEILEVSREGEAQHDEAALLLVRNEENDTDILLRSRIVRDDVYQKQQDTLIVWTEPNGVDMALSFQEAEGCAEIWEFVSQVQNHLIVIGGGEDMLSDDNDLIMPYHVALPTPMIDTLAQIEALVRDASATVSGREALAKFILNEDYLVKLVQLLPVVEDMHSLVGLHQLCNIVKCFILLNDQSIFEYAMRDEVVFGIAGILEYDPDFPHHKANHRQYLLDESRFREVVPIKDQETRRKVHQTFRLQYFKDVVLARFIDDATYGIFHSLILFNQVDIIQYLQQNPDFMNAIFALFTGDEEQKKKEATFFIAQYCTMVKQLQPACRSQPFNVLVSHGLFNVFEYAFNHQQAAVRLAATDVLTLITENDPSVVRSVVLRRFSDNARDKQLLSTLIRLVHDDPDLGLKGQITEAIRILLDPLAGPLTDAFGKPSELVMRQRQEDPEADKFLAHFYDVHVHNLMRPIIELDERKSLTELSHLDTALFTHLCDLLCFFVRMHSFRSKYFVLTSSLSAKIGRLFEAPEQYLQLAALRFFRTCIGLHDEFYTRNLIKLKLLSPIVDLVVHTGPKDNLINSAGLEFFDFIRRENMKSIIAHLATFYREKIVQIKYVDTFDQILSLYDRSEAESNASRLANADATESSLLSPSRLSATSSNAIANGTARRWQDTQSPDNEEENYFNAEEESESKRPRISATTDTDAASENGRMSGQLVNYSEEDEEDDMFETKTNAGISKSQSAPDLFSLGQGNGDVRESKRPEEPVPEWTRVAAESTAHIAAKRRKKEGEAQEDDTLSQVTRKRRSSARRHSSAGNGNSPSPSRKKIAISIGKKSLAANESNPK